MSVSVGLFSMQISIEHSRNVQEGSICVTFDAECHEHIRFDLRGQITWKIKQKLVKIVGGQWTVSSDCFRSSAARIYTTAQFGCTSNTALPRVSLFQKHKCCIFRKKTFMLNYREVFWPFFLSTKLCITILATTLGTIADKTSKQTSDQTSENTVFGRWVLYYGAAADILIVS